MFDVYMEGQRVDPRLRARMMMAVLAATAVTMAAGAASWTMGRLSVSSVGAPQARDVLELALVPDFIHRSEPPPRPERPEPEVKAAAAAMSPDAGRKSAAPTESVEVAPTDDLTIGTATPRRTPVGIGSGGGGPGVPGPKQQGCVGPGCLPEIKRIGDPPPRRRPSEKAVERAPLSVLKARSIYSPDPKASDLAKTKTGLGARRPGTVKVEFCVGPRGMVASAKIKRRFGSDPGVDKVCLDAVKRWRFKPARIDGKARTTCSDVTFDLRFE